MGDVLDRIIDRMKKKGQLSPRAFTTELSYVRFSKEDSRTILNELSRKKRIKYFGSGKSRKILFIKR